MQTQAAPMDARRRRQDHLRLGDRRDHRPHRSAGQRPEPPGLGHRPAGDPVPRTRPRTGHRHRRGASCCIALGYLGILVADGLNPTGRWTRGLSRTPPRDSVRRCRWSGARPGDRRSRPDRDPRARRRAAHAGPARLGLRHRGGGGGPLQLTDPTLDLRRNLNQPDRPVVIDYTTNRPGGVYLRMASLPEFDASGLDATWRCGWTAGPAAADSRRERRAGADAGRRTSRCSTSARSTCRCRTHPQLRRRRATGATTPTSLVMLPRRRRDQDRRDPEADYTAVSVDIDPDPRRWRGAVAGTPVDSDVTA